MVYESKGKKYHYWRQKNQILKAEVQYYKDGWWKKIETTEVVKEFRTEVGAETALRKFLEKIKSIKVA